MTSSQTISQLARIDSGYPFKSKDWLPDGLPVVKIGNVKDGYVTLEGCAFVSQSVADRATDFLASGGDILISLTGYVGQVGRVLQGDQVYVNQRVGLVQPREDSDRAYIYFLLRSLRSEIESLGTGSAQSNVSPRDIERLPIPPLSPGQRRANAGLLEDLEKLIQTNRKLSNNLESIAQTLFRSWFVDFDPVRAKMAGEKPAGMDDATAALFPDSMVESDLGEIPSGWQSGSLGDLIEIHDSKRIPLSSTERKGRKGIYPYYGATGVLDYVDGFLFSGPHVLVGEDGTVITKQGKPVVQYVCGDFWVNNHAHVLTGKGHISTQYLKLLLETIDIANYITGGVQQKLNQGNLRSVPAILPPPGLTIVFNSFASMVFEKMIALDEQSRSLSEIRDALLPRLISGELEVPESLLVS